MDTILAVFLNRTHTLQFSRCLTSCNVINGVVNTPRELVTACGISVKFNFNRIDQAKFCLSKMNIASFKHFYRIITYNNITRYEPI